MKVLTIIINTVSYALIAFIVFMFAMLIIPNACFQYFGGYQREKPLTAPDAPRFLGFSSADGLIFEQGTLVHEGRDYLAFGRYRMTESFNEKDFINKHNLVQPQTEQVSNISTFTNEAPWYQVSSEMKKLTSPTPANISMLAIWIDDINQVVFVEKYKF